MQIDGHTRLAAVVAKPIKHSLSPFIHNRAFQKAQVNGVYVAWEIEEADLAETVANIRRYDMWGINLSMPYKQAVIPYLDGLSPAAELIGAVNTVVHQAGELVGHNTDGAGFFRSLGDFSVTGKSVTVLGGGGAAMAICAEAVLQKASALTIFKRYPLSAEFLQTIERLQAVNECQIVVYDYADQDQMRESIASSDLLVNATSIGMDGSSLPIPADVVFSTDLLVADVIYQPFETPLLTLAKSQGVTTVNGLGMLLYQAAEAFRLWTGKEMPTEAIWTDLQERFRS